MHPRDTVGAGETDTNGAVSDNGNEGDNTVEVDGGTTSHQYPLGNAGTHNDASSVDVVDVSNAGGPFTTSAGIVATADLKYGDRDTSKVHQTYSDLTSSSNGQGGTTTWTDSLDWTDKLASGDSGERDETSSATTDLGTTTNTDRGLGTYSNTTTVTSPTITSSMGITNGDASDSFGSDNYDVTAASRADKDVFDNEDRPTGAITTQLLYTAPNDPGTNTNSKEIITNNLDNVDDGTDAETNGNVNNETDNFTDTTNGTDDKTYKAASDVGPAQALLTPSVPALTYTRIIVWLGEHGSGQYLSGGYNGPTTTSGTASLTSGDTENDLSDGTTTNTNGAVNTNETFDDSNKSNETATVSTTATAVNPAPGNDYTSSYTGTETQNGTDNSDGTIDGGVTKDNYDDTGTQTDTIIGNTTSDGTSGSGNSHSTSILIGTDTQIDTELGDYTTEPPGTQPPAPTPHNPSGDAILDQTIDYSENATRTETHRYSGGAGSSLSYNGDYTAKETLSDGSDSTVDVNVAENEDNESGGYNSNAMESQVGNYHEQQSSPGVTRTMDNHHEHSGWITVGGTYGGKEGDSWGSTSLMTESDTTTYTYPGGGSYTISHSSNGNGAGGDSSTGNAPDADVDPAAGQYTQADPSMLTATSKDVGPAADGAWAAFRNTVRDGLDKTQDRLGVLGMIPAAGIVPDVINTGISLGRGNFKDAAFNGFAAIPVIGDAARAAKLAKAGKAAGVVGDVARGANKVENAGQAGKAAIIGKSAATEAADNAAQAASRLTPEQVAKFPGCFFAGTLASTELGQMPIERVAPGNRTWAFDLRTCRWELCEVVETYEVDYIGAAVELWAAGVRIDSTYHHPYWVIEGLDLDLRPRPEHIEDAWEPNAGLPGRWVDAGELLVGDVLVLRDGRRAPVEAVTIREVATKVYNFQVAGLHNYAVGCCGVLVHNNSMQPSKRPGTRGHPDHQADVNGPGRKQAEAQAGPGETVLTERPVQGHPGVNRRADNQVVGADGKTRVVVESERRPNGPYHKKRIEELEGRGIDVQTRPLP